MAMEIGRISEFRPRIDIRSVMKATADQGELGTGGGRRLCEGVEVRLKSGPRLRIGIAWDYLGPHDRQRPWLVCPRCRTRRRHLYEPGPLDGPGQDWLCRDCLQLQYGIRTMYQQRPYAWRVRRLRESIGASPFPFTELPPRPLEPRARARYDAIALEIGRCEDRILAEVSRMTAALERLAKRKGFIPKSASKDASKPRARVVHKQPQ